MIEKEKVLSGLHCRGQDLMIDPQACDGCKYQVHLVNCIYGCDFRQLCRDAIDLLKEQPEIIRCKDCKFYQKPEYGFTKGDCTYGSVWYQTEEDGFCSKAKVKD